MNYCFHGNPAHLCRQCVVDERDTAYFLLGQCRNATQTAIEVVTACPRCGGRLTIGDDPRLLTGRGRLWLNCGTCGLFQQAEPREKR